MKSIFLCALGASALGMAGVLWCVGHAIYAGYCLSAAVALFLGAGLTCFVKED